MIDLHTHTTASDGRCAPGELVSRARAAGITVLSVTDHDTLGACAESAAACGRAGIAFVPGIEITAVCDDRDVHVLAYFIDPASHELQAFLDEQRQGRIVRVRRMIQQLTTCGLSLDADAILQPALDDPSRAAGRPWIARALVAAGYVATSDDAFRRWLEPGKPGYAPRVGPSLAEVVGIVHRAGGITSLAHPILVRHDEWIAGFVESGLDALEAYHSDHDAFVTRRYVEMAARLGVAVTGGSDFHGDASHGPSRPGSVSLPRADYDRLLTLVKPTDGTGR